MTLIPPCTKYIYTMTLAERSKMEIEEKKVIPPNQVDSTRGKNLKKM